MQKPPRLVQIPTVRPETQAAFINAQVATVDLFYADKGGPAHCAFCYGRAVAEGIVFG